VLDPELESPVFVDPSGRRRRTLRAIVIAGGIVTVGYLSVVLLAVLGAPLPPAARLPVPPQVDSGSTTGASTTTATTPDLAELGPASTDDPGTTRTTRTSSAGTPKPSTSTPAPTTTSDRARPTGPPGQGKPPTTPPGHG